jgi:hypothetical protein
LFTRGHPRATLAGQMKLLAAFAFVLVLAAPTQAAETLFPGDKIPIDKIVLSLAAQRPLSLKPVGTSSVVFKMDLEGSIDAAWKPRTRSHPLGHLAEVAAFRIGRVLGLDNIAPAVPRSLPLSTVHALLGDKYAADWATLEPQLMASGDDLEGAAIYWIPDMHELGLDSKDGFARWARWLAQDGDPPSRDKSKTLAADVSTMICFDYLIGNWDRFSGANAQGDHDERRVFVRDHNVAFAQPLPRPLHERVLGRLRKVERFSRSFISALKALDQAALERALAVPGDPPGFSALDKGRVEALLDRRRGLLSYIAAVIDRYGEAKVLSFP